MSTKVYLLVGFLGSGKSTWARRHVQENPNTVIINRDALRTMFFGKYDYLPAVEFLVRKCAYFIVEEAIYNGFDVIIDETNLSRAKRFGWLLTLQKCTAYNSPVDLEVIHFTESENNVAYRAQDDLRGVSIEQWAEVLKKMKRQYEPPESDEFPEGTKHTIKTMGEGG